MKKQMVLVGVGLVLVLLGIPVSLRGGLVHDYARSGDLAGVKRLIEGGSASVDEEGVNGDPIILHAASAGHFGIVKYLIGRGAKLKVVGRAKARRGISLGFYVASGGRIDLLRLLYEKGAILQEKGKREREIQNFILAQHSHSGGAYLELFRFLHNKLGVVLEGNLDLYGSGRWSGVGDRRQGQQYLLENICRHGKALEIIRWLHETMGFRLDGVDSIGLTLMHYAVIEQDRPLIEYLLSKGVDINSSPSRKGSPLAYLFKRGWSYKAFGGVLFAIFNR